MLNTNLLKKEIEQLPCRDNIACFLLYGSILKKKKFEDVDIIIVVKDIKINIDSLFTLVYTKFPKPDFHLYSVEEIESNLSFFTREYVMEYLAKALCVFGENPFKTKFNEVTHFQYQQSLLVRSIEHVQMVRKVFFSQKCDYGYKEYYLKKYFNRLAKNLLLFRGICDYERVNTLSEKKVIKILVENKILKRSYSSRNFSKNNLSNLFEVFCEMGKNLILCKRDLLSHELKIPSNYFSPTKNQSPAGFP